MRFKILLHLTKVACTRLEGFRLSSMTNPKYLSISLLPPIHVKYIQTFSSMKSLGKFFPDGTVEINGTTRTDDYPSMLLLTNLTLEDFRTILTSADDSSINDPRALIPNCTFGGAPCRPE